MEFYDQDEEERLRYQHDSGYGQPLRGAPPPSASSGRRTGDPTAYQQQLQQQQYRGGGGGRGGGGDKRQGYGLNSSYYLDDPNQ